MLVELILSPILIHFFIIYHGRYAGRGVVSWSCVVIFSKLEMVDFDENILPRNSLTHILNVNSTDRSVDHEINLLRYSPYYDNDQLVKMITNKSDQFSILNLNIQNINSKFDQVRIILDGLESKNCEFSAIFSTGDLVV